MTHAITGIDHCIVLVNDLDAARERMQSLGFKPAPRGVHSDHMGSHNHCVMLERGYFEVLAIRIPTERNQRWRDVLARREGLAAIALQTSDARAAQTFFHANDVAASDIVDFARPVEFDGVVGEARFTTVTLPGEVAPVPMFLCQHHTPEFVWREEHLSHPNGVRGVLGLVLAVAEPHAHVPTLGRAFGSDRVNTQGEDVRVQTEAGFIDITTHAGLMRRYPGESFAAMSDEPLLAALVLSAQAVGETARYLAEHDVQTTKSADGELCIPPAQACGALLEIRAG
jgi:hypothetical protein